jgi:colanic acid biosynthesis glycosyl transferase WcaI
VTTLRRILHETSFIVSSCARALAGRRPELLVTVSPPLGLALSSVLLQRRWGIPYVFHVPDLQPDAAVDLGMLPSGRVVKLLYAVERLAYRRAALVSTLTGAMRQRIVAKGLPPERVTLFPDWADPALFELPLTGGGVTARRELGLGGRFAVLHAGNMGIKQGLDVVLDAAARTRDVPDIVYLLVGDGAARPALEARARAAGLRNLRFLPLQPDALFRDLLAAADLTLVTQQRVVADIVFPSKVLTLLAAGRPVVASLNASSEVARVVMESESGLVTPAEDGEALAEAVRMLRAAPARRQRMGCEGRAYARAHWDRTRTLADMEQALGEVVSHHRRGTDAARARMEDPAARVDRGRHAG